MTNETLPPLEARPLTEPERHAVLDRIDELLELTYRSRDLGNFPDPLEEVIYILMSRQTREAVYQRVHRELRSRWPSWHELRAAPARDVEAVIAPAGFGPTRAAQLRGLLDEVAAACEARGITGLTLDWLRDVDDVRALQYLESLPGIGPKSARCVLHYSLGRDAFAVDTHVRRILGRLGLVPDGGEKPRHAGYEELVPSPMRRRLHVNLIHHGRAVCRTARPQCARCPLASFCVRGREADRSSDPRPVAVELFAGGGGMGEGFTLGGFRIAAAVEMDRHAAQTYRVNHPGTVVLEADVREISGAVLTAFVPGAASPAAIIAGPPCQGYSAAGSRQPDDDKNQLFREVIRLARELKPRFVAIENVPGMRGVGGVSFVDAVLLDLETAGYHATEQTLRACDFGVPQLRSRLIFLAQAREHGLAPLPPEPTHCPGTHCDRGCGQDPGSQCHRPAITPTVLDALRGLPPLGPGEEAEYRPHSGGALLNGSTMNHSAAVVDKIRGIQPGNGPISYRRLHPDMARTIVAGHRALPVHPQLHRTISVREAARIQGFHDSHVFAGKRTHQPLQVANAVPPALAKAVAGSLLTELGALPHVPASPEGEPLEAITA